jgi:hypothetical protein
MAKKNQAPSTLGFLEIAEIRDSTLVLREGQMRAVLSVSSANFALKSGEEQQMIINSYQRVLNSLEFPLQILVQSRQLNLDPYIEQLRQLEEKQSNDLLRVKMQEYIEYIRQMIKEVNIIKKDFFIIVGYDPASLKQGIFGSLARAFNPTKIIRQSQDDFLRNKKMLMGRVDQISSLFNGLDLKINILNTEQLIALTYNSYNPDTLESVRLKEVGQLDIELI